MKTCLLVPIAEALVLDGRGATRRAVRFDVGAALCLVRLLEVTRPPSCFLMGSLLEVGPLLLGLDFVDQRLKFRRRQFINIAQLLGSGFGRRRWIAYIGLFAFVLAVEAAEDHVLLFLSKV